MINVKWSLVLNFTFIILNFDFAETGHLRNKNYLI